MPSLAVFVRKGGPGKSTIASNLAHFIAKQGFEVELYGSDGQANESGFFGYTDEDFDYQFMDYLEGKAPLKEVRKEVRENLHIITTKRNQEGLLDNYIGKHVKSEFLFNKIFRNEPKEVYRIFDCGPTGMNVTQTILNFVDYLIVPVQLEYAGFVGIPTLWNYLYEIDVDEKKLLAFIPNMHKAKHSDSRKYLTQLKSIVSQAKSIMAVRDDIDESQVMAPIVTESISSNAGIPKGQGLGKTIFEMDKSMNSYYDRLERQFTKIAVSIFKEIIKRENGGYND